MKTFLTAGLFSLMVAASTAQAAPTLAVGSASGRAGTAVNIPITFNPTTDAVAGLQFNLTLPTSISTVSVTAGSIVTAASKTLSSNKNGSTWTFIVFGLNQTAIGSGTLLTAQVRIAPGTAAGVLSVPISGIAYTDANGQNIVGGTSTGGSITVVPAATSTPVIGSAGTATGTVGTAFSYQITATNSPTSFNATGLPAGLSVNTTTGLISGTPTTAGTSNITLSATNSGGTGTKTLTLTINLPAPVIGSAGTASGTVGTSFSYQITATNSPTSFNATGLPAGLSVNTTTGLISGTPTTAGTSNVTLSATNSGGTGTKTLTLTINVPVPVIGSAGTASGTVGTAFSYQITASNSPTSYNATGLPAGLSVNTTTGLISGTPTTAGTSNVTLSASNSGGTGTKTLTLTISPPVPVIGSAATASGTVGTAFSYQITATNSPTSFNATGLPAGLSINTATGLISGTPTTAGTSNVTLSATNSGGTGTKALTLTINAPLPPAPVIGSAGTASGTVGVAFSYQITATNSPTSFNATGLPAGLSINTTSGLISGTPTTAGTSNVTLSATNSGGTGTKALTLAISAPLPPAPVIGSAGTATGTVGTTFSYQITATNSPTSFNATGLPAGLSVNTTTGLISGTPTTAGTSNVTLSATNSGGTGTKTLTLTINPPAPVIGSAGTASGTVGTSFSYQITATNSPTSFNATGLPAGLSVNTTTGLISGTPTTAGTSNVTLGATNSGGTGTKVLTLTINAPLPPAPVIGSAGTATGTVGVAFSYQITATNSPTSFNATGLPAGLLVNTTTGLISGTPTAVGTSNVTLSATNSGGAGTKTLTLTINPPAPVIGSAATASGTVGVAFSYQITATNGPTSFNATGLPAGLSVNTTTGLISGTPTTAGTSNVTLSATNSGGTGTKALTLTINPPAPVIGSAGTASGTVGTAFSYQITATNSPTSFNATGLPAGLSINTTTGLISGTPTTAGTSTVTLSATNSGGTGTKVLTLTINAPLPPAPVIGSAATASGTVGTAFSYQITATNSPTSFNATGLPAGLSVNTTSGLISGTPTTAGTSNVTLSATNSGGTGTKTLTLTVNAPLPPAPVIGSASTASGTVGVAFSYQITATNSPTSFNAPGLPAGLSINTTSGLISGTPTTAGTSNVTLSATNSGGTGTKALTLTINAPLPPAPVIGSAGTASGTVGTAFSYQITATNSPTSFNATGLPAGLSVNTTSGLISGTPTTAGTSNVTLSATNSGGTGTKTLTLTVNAPLPPAPVIGSASTASGTVGVAFSYQITATNSPTSFNATGLPAGLSVNTTSGLISGTPTTAGTSNVTLSATNSGGTGTKTLTLTVNAPLPPAPVIGSASTATGTVGTTFSYQITATNSPTSFNATGLPAGLSINTTTGLISGTPTTPGPSNVTLSATNTGGTGTKTLTLTINPPAPVIGSAATASGTVGTVFSYQITATNSPTSFNATGLPAGLSVNTTTGLISGTPTTAGTSNVTLSATNSGGTGTKTLTLTVNAPLPPAPVIGSAGTASGTVGTAFSYQITATNSPTSFNATGLPAGLSVNTTTGLISGTPTTAGTSNVTLSATNSGGTGTKTLVLTIDPMAIAPTLTMGSASGQAGTAVNLPIAFNTGSRSVSGIQFDLTLPPGISTVSVTGGSIVSDAGKSLSSSASGTTWTLIVFGINQNVIGSGTLLTAQVMIAPGTPAAILNMPISRVAYTDPNGLAVTPGTSTGGSITVLPTVTAAPVIGSAGAASGTVGTAFSYQITATNSPTSFNATGLPAGLSINTTTGLISGTPTTAGTSNVTLSATNSGGTGTKTLTLTINPPAPVIGSAGAALGTVGTVFSYQITATNSPTSFNATGLPAGLSINTTTGLISGTPTTPGTSNVTLSATNSGGTGTKTLTLTINPPTPVIASAGTASGTVGTAFSYQITASNSPTSFNATGLPAGLSINTTTGLISGTPTTAGTSNVTLSATNSGGTGTKALTLTINAPLPPAPVIGSAATASGTVGTVFSYQITATNSPTSFNATGLPAGLSVNTTTGLISGTPTTAGTSNVTLSATNSGGTGTKTLTLTVNAPLPPAPVIGSAGTASGTVGTAFSYQITATNSPTSFNATGLPAGLSVNPTTGLISGTPTTAGTSNVTLSATNSGGTGTKTLVLTIDPMAIAPTLTMGSASGQAGTAVNLPIAFNTGSRSVSGIQFDLTLPPGISTVSVTGGSIVSDAGKSLSSSASGTTWTLIVFGINQNVIGSGTLLTAQVMIAPGTPAAILNMPISRVAYTDPNGLAVTPGTSTGGSITVLPTVTAAPVIGSAGAASATVGTAFSYQITATNSPTSFNATGLPAGLSVNTTTGLISGTPTTAGTSNISLSATNSGGTGTKTLTLTINPPAPVIASAGTASGTVGTVFSYQITASNSPTSFNATGLPAGLAINTTTGLISGTPTTAGTSNVTLSATNSGGTGTKALTLTVNAPLPPAPVIGSAGTASGTVGTAFSYQITATNSPTSFNATGLPASLSINSTTGLISGTPTTAGTSNISLSATNSGGTGTKTLTLTIDPAAIAPTMTMGSATGQAGTAVNLPITFDPGTGAVSGIQFDLTLPPGISTVSVTAGSMVSSAGKSLATSINGATWTIIVFGMNQTTIGSGTLLTAQLMIAPGTTAGVLGMPVSRVAYTDADGRTITPGASTGGNITVLAAAAPAPVITSPLIVKTVVNKSFTYQITATNNPTSFGATGLPAGLAVNPLSGILSGVPTSTGTFNVTLTATHSTGTGTAVLSLTVNAKRNPKLNRASLTPQGATSASPALIPAANRITGVTTVSAPAFLLKAEGSDFAAGDTLYWNNSQISTTLADSAHLAAYLPGSMVRTGEVTLQVMTSDGELSEPLTFLISLVPGDLAEAKVFPNPWRSDKHAALVTFGSLTMNTSIKIFTVSGHWVKTLPTGSGSVTWDLTNDSGNKVASGIYVYLMTTDQGQKKTGQIVVVK